MTLAEARALRPGTIVYEHGRRNADGSPRRWKVNGQVKTWKRDPSRVRVPLKHGLYTHDYLDEKCLDYLHLTEQEATDACSWALGCGLCPKCDGEGRTGCEREEAANA